MDLNDEERKTFGPCYVCGHAGWDIVLWPQLPTEAPEYLGDTDGQNWTKPGEGTWTTGKWKVYVTSYIPTISSGKKVIDACLEHYNRLGANWIAVAQCEVDLENIWHDYMGRVER